MKVVSYIQDDYINRQSFEHKVKEILKDLYHTPFDINITFNNCMAYGYAIVCPISNQFPKGLIMVTEIYRTEVTFLI